MLWTRLWYTFTELSEIAEDYSFPVLHSVVISIGNFHFQLYFFLLSFRRYPKIIWSSHHPFLDAQAYSNKTLNGETGKRHLNGKPRDVFQSIIHAAAARAVINFLVKTLYASITSSNFQIRCLDRECVKTHVFSNSRPLRLLKTHKCFCSLHDKSLWLKILSPSNSFLNYFAHSLVTHWTSGNLLIIIDTKPSTVPVIMVENQSKINSLLQWVCQLDLFNMTQTVLLRSSWCCNALCPAVAPRYTCDALHFWWNT